jgi:hypothetical protein
MKVVDDSFQSFLKSPARGAMFIDYVAPTCLSSGRSDM